MAIEKKPDYAIDLYDDNDNYVKTVLTPVLSPEIETPITATAVYAVQSVDEKTRRGSAVYARLEKKWW